MLLISATSFQNIFIVMNNSNFYLFRVGIVVINCHVSQRQEVLGFNPCLCFRQSSGFYNKPSHLQLNPQRGYGGKFMDMAWFPRVLPGVSKSTSMAPLYL